MCQTVGVMIQIGGFISLALLMIGLFAWLRQDIAKQGESLRRDLSKQGDRLDRLEAKVEALGESLRREMTEQGDRVKWDLAKQGERITALERGQAGFSERMAKLEGLLEAVTGHRYAA